MRYAENWAQLAKFCTVGGSGYAINLIVFAICTQLLGMYHLAAAVVAFLVAVTNNFWWNRHWTFAAADGRAHFQALRFLLVALVAFLLAVAALDLLVTVGHVEPVVAQAASTALIATPVNFIGNKMWVFRLAREPLKHGGALG